MTKTFSYKEQAIDYQIIYKKRKTMGIYIDVYGNIELRVPRETKDNNVENMLKTKWEWIINKSEEMKEKTRGFKKKEYVEGENFLYLGESYPISIVVNKLTKNSDITLEDDRLIITINEQNDELIKKILTKFYKQKCKRLIESRIRYYQQHFKSKPKSIKITSNKKTWGTCNSLREMTFNWKLIMAPIEIIDYVVAHEMCHMVHLNHDRSFWRLLGKYIPNYEERQQWLKESHWKMVV